MAQNVELVKRLGRGSQGSVYSIRHDNHESALKLFSWEDMNTIENQMELVVREVVGILQTPIFRGIFQNLKEVQSNESKPNIGISLERYDCNLHQFKYHIKGDMPTNFIREIFMPIMTQLYNLHQDGLLHRDIKPANILLNGSSKTSTLVDYSLTSGSKHADLCAQTQTFRPPEIFKLRLDYYCESDWYSSAADVFAFGMCILFCVMPFDEQPIGEKDSEETCLKKLTCFLENDFPEFCNRLEDKDLVMLLRGCLSTNVETRLTMVEVSQCFFWHSIQRQAGLLTKSLWDATKQIGLTQSSDPSKNDRLRMYSFTNDQESFAVLEAEKKGNSKESIGSPSCALTQDDREQVLKQFLKAADTLQWTVDTFVVAWNLFDYSFSTNGQSYLLNDETSMQNDVFLVLQVSHILFEGHHKNREVSPFDTVIESAVNSGLLSSEMEKSQGWQNFVQSFWRLLQSIQFQIPFTQQHKQYVKLKEWSLLDPEFFEHFKNVRVWQIL